MILVTGAYGFIGSKFVKHLNTLGITDIVVSDYLTNGRQYKNLNGCKYWRHIHPDTINVKDYKVIFHFGAISDTTCWDGELVMRRNYEFTVNLIDRCDRYDIPLSYSSSASVYGNGDGPLNLYAYSKWLVDQYVEQRKTRLMVQGFRYFNVYSTDDAEWHKGDQASPFYKFKQQALETGRIEIFEGSENFKRDFVPVDRVCEVQWNMLLKAIPGIYDLGTGKQMSFREVAETVANDVPAQIVEIPFPEKLRGCYQSNTLADMTYYFN